MKDDSRRNVLLKLGAGAGAVAAMFAGRNALAQDTKAQQGTCEVIGPVIGTTGPVTVEEIGKKADKAKERIVEVKVGKEGYSAAVWDAGTRKGQLPEVDLGWDRDNQLLRIAVIEGKGGTTVHGLGRYTASRITAEAGRCWISSAK